LLTPLPLKARLLLAAGAEAVVVLPFSHELAFLKPAEFLQSCLLGTPFRLEAVCVGAGWRFGHLGAGDTRLLRHFGREHGFAVAAVRELHFHNGMVSSTRIRKSLREGRLRFAARLLGRPYAIEGEVVHGRGAGGPQLDCHTANVDCNGQLLPPHGVYAARAVIEPDASPAAGAGPRHQPAIAYIGTARTLAAAAEPPRTVLECHLFDYDGTLYGRRLAVELLEFVRPDQVFPTVATLRGQIASDLLRVREITHAWHAMNKPDVPRVV
jgi:riboflavin kinase/FMN adenylyltransferase